MAVSALGILNAAAGAAGIHSWLTGLRTGTKLKQVLAEIANLKLDVQRISSRILYLPSVREVYLHGPTIDASASEIVSILQPIAQTVETDILVSGTVAAPPRLAAAARDMRSLLVDVRAFAGTPTFAARDNMIPVVFTEGGVPFVGWQTSAALKYGFDYEPWVPLPPFPGFDASVYRSIILQNSRHIAPSNVTFIDASIQNGGQAPLGRSLGTYEDRCPRCGASMHDVNPSQVVCDVCLVAPHICSSCGGSYDGRNRPSTRCFRCG